MDLQSVALYFFADEVLKASHLYDDPQATMTNAEVITPLLAAAKFFFGNQRRASLFLKEYHYIPHFLSESRFNHGLRAHVIVTTQQEPVECFFAPGSENDTSAFKRMKIFSKKIKFISYLRERQILRGLLVDV